MVETPVTGSKVVVEVLGRNLKCHCPLGDAGAVCCHKLAVELELFRSAKAEVNDVDLLKATKAAAGKVKKSGKKGGDEIEKRPKRSAAVVQGSKGTKRLKRAVVESNQGNEASESSGLDNVNDMNELIEATSDDELIETTGADDQILPIDANAANHQNETIDLSCSTGGPSVPATEGESVARLIGETNWLNDRVLDEVCDKVPVTNDRFLWIPTGMTSSVANLAAFIRRHVKAATKFVMVILNTVDNSIS